MPAPSRKTPAKAKRRGAPARPQKRARLAGQAKRPRWRVETVPVDGLHPHPRNYRAHPEEQVAHIEHSIRQHGVYRNVVVARDYTILAGHGVVAAARRAGEAEVPVVRIDVPPDSPRALKILASDNELGRFAEVDDRALTEILREVSQLDELLGTGFNEQQLASLLMVTRPAAEIRDGDEAAHWVGLPSYEDGAPSPKLVVTFTSEEDRARFAKQHGMRIDKKTGLTWSTRWPFTEREDVAGVRFETA